MKYQHRFFFHTPQFLNVTEIILFVIYLIPFQKDTLLFSRISIYLLVNCIFDLFCARLLQEVHEECGIGESTEDDSDDSGLDSGADVVRTGRDIFKGRVSESRLCTLLNCVVHSVVMMYIQHGLVG